MKTIEELRQTPHLVVHDLMKQFPVEHQVYDGFVSWPDFTGSVVFGMNHKETEVMR